MDRRLYLCVVLLFSVVCAYAAPPDSSAFISSAKSSFQFVYNHKEDRVEIKQISTTNYVSNNYQVNLPISETYNNKVKIDDIDCKVDNHTPKDFKPLDSYYSVSDVFYSDERICYFPLFLNKKGSTANVTFNETITDPRYFTSIFFPENLAVTTKDVVLKIPRWMKVELKEMNFGGFNIKKTSVYDSGADADIITYTAQNLPAMYRESNSPGPTYIYPHLMVLCKQATAGGHSFTYFNTLADQYGWYRELVKGVVNDKDILAAKAKEITAGLATGMDKIKAVFYYVQNNIRYIAFEDGMAGFKPEKADEVLRKKYGDCKGMANLTKALLVALGYDARLCWLGTDHIAYDYQTPSMAVDNHMICGLNYQGKTIYLDATETYLGINEYAERIQGRQVLMEDGDKYLLNRIPVATSTQNYDFENSKLTITGNSLTGNVDHLWKGEDREMVISGLNSIKKEKTDDAMIRFLSDENTNYGIHDLKMQNMDDPDKELTVAYNVDHKNAVSSFSKAYYVDLDLKKEFLTSAIKTAERKHDYWFYHRMNIVKQTELTIPVDYKASSIPPNLDIVNADYEFHIQYTAQTGKLNYKKSILIKNTHLAATKFEQWNKDIEQLAKTYNESVVLKPINQ
ncbi:transglutaminase superfamily protein [Mucilaginibacter gracilis]|uniref:Transglutaminase superfamily protein n=1 Tax=Mucilaginibacter gracilis TaxID=423350 RepID=A0A495J3R1_9SPHI|nr:transglutaminase-like domain-containing protein [Mucilaginibacter gracilis]RKR83463.1 transglutaminase superfamily protein [Mucilaginibacter gracilis]